MKSYPIASTLLVCALVLGSGSPLSALAGRQAEEPLSPLPASSPGTASQILSTTNLHLGNVHFVQASEIIPMPSFEGEHVPTPAEIAVLMAEQWLMENGHLTDPDQLANTGVSASVSDSGITIVFSSPGLHIVIVLSNSPFLPIPDFPDHRLISGTIFEQISNGI